MSSIALNDRGWSTLGDIRHLDDDGYVHLSDRRTDLIISGAVSICPTDIEGAIIMHLAVTSP
jgi:long-chain acyl-CoA synthetase